MVDFRLYVLCSTLAAAAATGAATPLWAQQRGDSVSWCLNCRAYRLQNLTRHDLGGLGRDQSMRRARQPLMWTPQVQRFDLAGAGTALGLVEPCNNAGCAQLFQSRGPATSRWPVAEPAPSFDPWAVGFKPAGAAGQQEMPLPVYDDSGNPISIEAIEARMRGGGTGAAAGGFLGGLVGGGLGVLLGLAICPIEYLGPGCSPRDEAYRTVAILSGFAWGIAGGILAGHEIEEIDRWEALEQIRAERRGAKNPGGSK